MVRVQGLWWASRKHSECSCPQWRPTRNKRTLKMDSQRLTLVEMPTCSPPCSSRRTPQNSCGLANSMHGSLRACLSKVEDGIATMLSSVRLAFLVPAKKDNIERFCSGQKGQHRTIVYKQHETQIKNKRRPKSSRPADLSGRVA